MTRHEAEEALQMLLLETATLDRDASHAKMMAARSTQAREEMMTEAIREVLAKNEDATKLPKFS
jgi:hypothetical protein